MLIHILQTQFCLTVAKSRIIHTGDLKRMFSYVNNLSIYYKHLKQREFILRFQLNRGSLDASKDSKKVKKM